MGDIRFLAPFRQVKQASDRVAAIRSLDDESLVAALAGSAMEATTKGRADPLLVNVLASEAQNRARRKQTILATLGEGVFEVDDDGRVTFLNPAAEEILGWRLDEACGQTMHDLLHCATPSAVHKAEGECHLEDALRTSVVVRRHDERFMRRDGSVFPVDYTAAPILREGAVAGAVVVFRDITELRRAQERLEEARRFNERLLETAGEGIYGLDADGRATFVNRSATELLGWDARDLMGKRLHELTHHSHADGRPYPEEECPIYAAFHDGEVHGRDDDVFWRKDGSSVPVQYTSTPIWTDRRLTGAVVVFHDISERKRAEAQLRASRNLLESVVEGASAIMWVKDRDLRFVLLNEAGARAMGRPAQAFVGKTLEEVTGRDVDPTVEREDRAVVDRGETRSSEVNIPVNGETRVYHSVKSPWRDGEGRIIGLIGVSRDITERKRAENALAKSEQRLRTVVQHAPAILSVLDKDGVITFSEGRALTALGLRRGNVGRSIFDVYAHNPVITENVRRALAGEERQALLEERGHHFDTRWTPILDDAGKVKEVLAVTVDVTEIKQAEADRAQARIEAERAQMIDAHAQRLAALAEASRAFAEAALDREAALDTIARVVVQTAGDACIIRLLSEDGELLLPTALQHREAPRREALRRLFLGGPLPANDGVHARVLRERRPIAVTVSSPQFRAAAPREQVEALEGFGVKAFLLVPLVLKERAIGTMGFSREDDRPFTEDDQAFLEDLASRAALAIENARLHHAERAARIEAEESAKAIERLVEEFRTHRSSSG